MGSYRNVGQDSRFQARVSNRGLPNINLRTGSLATARLLSDCELIDLEIL
jgi:hypothetical protein